MTVSFILNGEDVTVRCDANIRLIDILRVNFGLLGAKAGCLTGKCGFCTVIFNGTVINSCLIPAFRLRGGEVITIEGFSQNNEYLDIVSGFAKAKLENCGFCENGVTLIAGALLEKNERPSREDILKAFNGIRCRCIDQDILAEGVENTVEIRRRRLYGRSS